MSTALRAERSTWATACAEGIIIGLAEQTPHVDDDEPFAGGRSA